MADGYEDLREDELPGPAYEGYESAELACPAERSGHVAVSDGRHMFVWGGYKVSRWPGRGGCRSAVTGSGAVGRREDQSGRLDRLPRPNVATPPVGPLFSASVGIFPRVSLPSQASWSVVTPAFCLQSPLPVPRCSWPPCALFDIRASSGEGTAGGAGRRNVFYLKGLGVYKR